MGVEKDLVRRQQVLCKHHIKSMNFFGVHISIKFARLFFTANRKKTSELLEEETKKMVRCFFDIDTIIGGKTERAARNCYQRESQRNVLIFFASASKLY